MISRRLEAVRPSGESDEPAVSLGVRELAVLVSAHADVLLVRRLRGRLPGEGRLGEQTKPAQRSGRRSCCLAHGTGRSISQCVSVSPMTSKPCLS